MSDSEQFSNRFELDLISLLVNFSCELGQIMTIYMTSHGLDEWFRATFEPTWTWPNFMFGQLFMWIGANYGQIWLHIGYMSDSEQCLDQLELLPNFTFGQLVMWIGANNDQIWLPMARWVILHDSFSDCFNILHRGAVLLEEYICRVHMAYMGKLGQLRVNITN